MSFSKSFAYNKLHETQMSEFSAKKVENMVKKRENADYQYFLLFPQCFQKPALIINPFPNDKFLDSSILKEFAFDYFNLTKMAGSFPNR